MVRGFGELMSGHWIKKKSRQDHRAVLFIWRRFFARMTDFLIWLLPWYFLEEQLFLKPWQHSLSHFLLDQFAACALMVLAEPFWLSRLSTTPGKALFGLRVYHVSGAALTPRQARRRSFLVWRQALGFGLPLYRLLILARAFAGARAGRETDWEENSRLQTLTRRGEA